jgi:hypothetical protein
VTVGQRRPLPRKREEVVHRRLASNIIGNVLRVIFVKVECTYTGIYLSTLGIYGGRSKCTSYLSLSR